MAERQVYLGDGAYAIEPGGLVKLVAFSVQHMPTLAEPLACAARTAP